MEPTLLREDINTRFCQAVNFLLDKRLAHNKNEVMNSLGLYLGRLSLILAGKANASTDNLSFLCRSYGVSPEWLLLGTGPMLTKDRMEPVAPAPTTRSYAVASSLPLIPMNALAGFNGIDEPGVRLDDCMRYVVPEFVEAGADFLIRIKGSSMIPTYMSGDLVACKKLQADSWIEYGDVYVIDGQQGVMLKRIYNDAEDTDKLLCKSDNPAVAPFTIRKSEVRSLSKVVGVIRNA